MSKIGKCNPTLWKLTYNKFEPKEELLREALCTLGNGYFASRGAFPEAVASDVHCPGTYVAGLYNKLPTRIAGRTIFNEDLVNCPNWLFLTFKIENDDWIIPSDKSNKILSFCQELDMQNGILSRVLRIKDSKNRITLIEYSKIVHMANPHCAAIKYTITPENYEGLITINSTLDSTVQNTNVARYRQLNTKHLLPNSLGVFDENCTYLSIVTSQSQIEIAQAATLRVFSQGKEIKDAGASSNVLMKRKNKIQHQIKIFAHKRQSYDIEKIVSIYTSKDKGVNNPLASVIKLAKSCGRFGFMLKSHINQWENLWKAFDVQIKGDNFSQRILRLHTFHLLQIASAHNAKIDAGLPARGLHGEAYRGHIFWDSIFVIPFFDLHRPEISKSFILYRYRRLEEAREAARNSGYRGAMFPWQSGSTGEEETQIIHLNPLSGKWDPDHSHIQRHVSFAIAYNVWHYWNNTGDLNFLNNYAAEIILSIAQFGASLAEYDPKDKRYHTHGLMGPDEFHEKYPGAKGAGLKDNAYTNFLIVWTLLRAKEILSVLSTSNKNRILKKIKLKKKEIKRWGDIVKKMNIIIRNDGVISQFDGYFKLKELDWKAYKAKYEKIGRLDRILKAEGRSPDDYKLSKQPDALMLFYLFSINEVKDVFRRLGYTFSRDILRKTYDYYVKRTSHGSTLSKVILCYIANVIGSYKGQWQWFLDVLKSDVYDSQGGTTLEGIHVGVMGGSIDVVMRGFAGIRILSDRVRIAPALPHNWRSIKLKFCYKQKNISLEVTDRHVTVFIHGPKLKKFEVPFEISDNIYYLSFEKTHKIPLKN